MASNHDVHCESLIVESFFESERNAIRWIREGIEELPHSIRPQYFSEGERSSRKPKYLLSNRSCFDSFTQSHSGGFFLHGDGFKIDVSLFSPIPSEVTFWASSRNESFVRLTSAVLRSFAEYGAVYAFACDWGEYRARNGYCMRYIEGGHSEDWCGRDFKRYVPGLYWLNYFSTDYVEAMGIDLASIQQVLNATLSHSTNGSILQLYDRPTDWLSRRDEVGDVIHSTEGVFSIRRIRIPDRVRFKEGLKVGEAIFKEWP